MLVRSSSCVLLVYLLPTSLFLPPIEMSFGVCIVRGQSRSSDRNVSFLYDLFEGYPVIEFTPTSSGLMGMYQTLYRVESEWPALPSLVIYDSSVSSLPRNDFLRLVEDAMPLGMDMLFLCHWLDSCATYRSVEGWTIFETSLMWTTQPSSQQAILYTVEARNFMLTNLSATNSTLQDYGLYCNYILAQKKLRAATFVSNLINFDINLVVRNEDYFKFNACTLAPAAPAVNRTQTLLIYIAIFCFILLAAWILILMNPSPKDAERNASKNTKA
jgi:hypothetical protein